MHFSRSPFIALAVTAMIGRSLHARNLADLADRVDAVDLRHHDVHQHDVDVRLRLQMADRVAAVVVRHDDHALVLEQRRQREDVAHVVVDDHHALALQHFVRSRAARVSTVRCASGIVAEVAMQEEARLLEQALGRAHVAHDVLRRRGAASR